VNVLEDQEIREGIKAYSSWPTIPQLYVKGEFIGGCDITREMFQAGELQAALRREGHCGEAGELRLAATAHPPASSGHGLPYADLSRETA
jgi:hypothetical protein